MNNRTPAEVFPPGDFIREELEARGWTQVDLGKIMDRPLPAINEIIGGKRAITPDTAMELAAAFGTSAEYWMNLESAYRLSLTSASKEPIRQRAKLFDIAPVKDMEKRGWISKTRTSRDLEMQLEKFFQIKSTDEIPSLAAAARSSIRDTEHLTAEQLAWCYRARNLAANIQVAPFNLPSFEDGCRELRKLATYPEEARKVPRVLANMGIRFVVVEHLPRTKIDGAAIWWEECPIIAMSLRHDRIDNFWHTLFHELSHIRHRDSSTVDVDMDEEAAERSEIELRADTEAAESLVPAAKLHSFIIRVRPFYSKERIVQFARTINVHPGIVAGQLQKRKEIKYAANREMLVKVRDIVIAETVTDGWGRMP